MRSRTIKALEPIDKHLPEWARNMIRKSEWQKSAVQSITFWLACTLVIYKLSAQLGHGLIVIIAVSLAVDIGTYLVNRFWIWPRRKVSIAKSASRSFGAWICFMLINATLAWALTHPADVGTMNTRYALGCYGILINPVIFAIRNEAIFAERTLRESALRCLRVFRKTVIA